MGAKIRELVAKHWRSVLAHAPLPMLAIPASYGVYEFTLHFAPFWVAVLQAAAFEGVYVGMAAYDKLTQADKWRGLAISLFAVLASIAYNTIAGAFALNPNLINNWIADGVLFWVLSALHGVPLALLAFLVSNFTLHRKRDSGTEIQSSESTDAKVPSDRKRKHLSEQKIYVKIERSNNTDKHLLPIESGVVMESSLSLPSPIEGLTEAQVQAVELASKGLKRKEIAEKLGVTPQAVSDRIQKARKSNPKFVRSKLPRTK